MAEVVWVCTGGCGAEISEEQYNGGLKNCGTEGCAHHGLPFEKRFKCETCGQVYKEEEKHSH